MTDDNDADKLLGEAAEFLDPPNFLKRKAGSGGIPQHLLDKGEGFIKENDIDFIPFAKDHIKHIKAYAKELKTAKNKTAEQQYFDGITENVMRLKAHGGMFGYDIMSAVSDITLNCLELTKTINDDLYQIIDAHNNSIELVIATKLRGNGGDQGKAIVNELRKATVRYHKKYSPTE